MSPAERLKKLMDYSQPMSDGRRALVLRLNQTVRARKLSQRYDNEVPCIPAICRFQEEDKEEMKEILEMKRTHDRLMKKRQSRMSKEKNPLETEVIIMKN